MKKAEKKPPGTFIIPKYFKDNIVLLCKKTNPLNVL